MRKAISYIFTIPASLLFLIAEIIYGEKIGWRYKEVMKATTAKCTKCGHNGYIIINDNKTK